MLLLRHIFNINCVIELFLFVLSTVKAKARRAIIVTRAASISLFIEYCALPFSACQGKAILKSKMARNKMLLTIYSVLVIRVRSDMYNIYVLYYYEKAAAEC